MLTTQSGVRHESHRSHHPSFFFVPLLSTITHRLVLCCVVLGAVATHIVLIDPVAGTKEEALSIEKQAIGRAHRQGQSKRLKVIRLIMKDTIEYDLYRRNSSNAQLSNELESSLARQSLKDAKDDGSASSASASASSASAASSSADIMRQRFPNLVIPLSLPLSLLTFCLVPRADPFVYM